MPIVLVTTCSMYRNRFGGGAYLLMGDELGSATDIDRLLAFSGQSTPNFTLIRNDDFFSCHTDVRPKMSPKIGKFGVSWMSRCHRVGFYLVNYLDLHINYCAGVSVSDLQGPTCSGWRGTTLRTFIRFLRLARLVSPQLYR